LRFKATKEATMSEYTFDESLSEQQPDALVAPAPVFSWWVRLMFPRLCATVARMAEERALWAQRCIDAAKMVLSARRRAEATLKEAHAAFGEHRDQWARRIREHEAENEEQRKIIETLRRGRESWDDFVRYANDEAYRRAQGLLEEETRKARVKRDVMNAEYQALVAKAAELRLGIAGPQPIEVVSLNETAQRTACARAPEGADVPPIFRMMIHPFGMVEITKHLSAQEREHLVGDSRAKRSEVDGRMVIDIGPLLSGRRRGEIQRAERGERFRRAEPVTGSRSPNVA
jgi:hypothetical protein